MNTENDVRLLEGAYAMCKTNLDLALGEVAILRTELAALRSSQEWRSIETAPLMQDVLVSLDTGGVAIHRKSVFGKWSCWEESSSPTAWLPLPPAGKEKGV